MVSIMNWTIWGQALGLREEQTMTPILAAVWVPTILAVEEVVRFS